MPLPAKLLRPGEEVVVDVRPHVWVLVPPSLAVVAVLVGGVTARVVKVPVPVAWAVVVVLAISLGWLVVRYLRWVTTSFVLTTDRLVQRSGTVARRTREIRLEQVASISCRQSLPGRVVGIGDLVVEAAGHGGVEVFRGMARPVDVERRIGAELAAGRARRSGAPFERSIPEQIDQLADLTRRGVLTREEFEAKKAQLLDRL